MVPASNPTGSCESDLDHGYSTLITQLQAICTLRASNNTFLLLEEDEAPRAVIPYWCFVQVSRSFGSAAITVCHPLGDEAGQTVIERARDVVISLCHSTNQSLLLEDLYKTRSACNLLIADDSGSDAFFSCPMQHRETMDLNIRCTPRQAIDSLISSTLHNFLVSNRRQMFVYRDEDQNVFYMNLSEQEHSVQLSVYGLTTPGPSIVDQLVALLQKNMLMLPLNAISSLLTKNPWYALLPQDVMFLRNFHIHMSNFDSDYGNKPAKSTRTYSLPPYIHDPLVILLLFRRNITGSTL